MSKVYDVHIPSYTFSKKYMTSYDSTGISRYMMVDIAMKIDVNLINENRIYDVPVVLCSKDVQRSAIKETHELKIKTVHLSLRNSLC